MNWYRAELDGQEGENRLKIERLNFFYFLMGYMGLFCKKKLKDGAPFLFFLLYFYEQFFRGNFFSLIVF